MGNCSGSSEKKKKIYVHYTNFALSVDEMESMDEQAAEEDVILVVIVGQTSMDPQLLHQKYYHLEPGVYLHK